MMGRPTAMGFLQPVPNVLSKLFTSGLLLTYQIIITPPLKFRVPAAFLDLLTPR